MLREMKNAGILGMSIFMPEKVVTNDYWNDKEFVNLPSRKSRESCFKGIEERRFFPKEMLPSDAESEAGKRALINAGVKPEEIDLLLVHSMVPDEVIPGNASLVQHKMGLINAGAWNMDTCCSSFVSMLISASSLIATGTFRKILIITSIFHSKILDENDYLSVVIGDGAGAVVMGEVSEDKGYLASHVTSDGYFHDAFTVRERMPLVCDYKRHYEAAPFKNLMTTNPEKTREMGKRTIEFMTPVMNTALEKASAKASDIDFFFSHQPVYWAHDAWREVLGLSQEKSYQTFNIYGNLASTSIPASMYHALQENKISDGDLVLFASSGAGENHAALVMRWGV